MFYFGKDLDYYRLTFKNRYFGFYYIIIFYNVT